MRDSKQKKRLDECRFWALFAMFCFGLSTSLKASQPPVNPWLFASAYPASHHDSAQTDSTFIDGPSISKQLSLDDVSTAPVIWSSAPTYKVLDDKTVVIASNPFGLIKILADGESFARVSDVPYPGREGIHREGEYQKIAAFRASIDAARADDSDWRVLLNTWYNYWQLNLNMSTMPSGAYAVIDKEGYHYTNYNYRFLVKSFDGNELDRPLRPVKSADIFDQLPEQDAKQVSHILGLAMTYDGYLAVAASGAVLIVDRDLQVKDYVLLPEEHVENSVAIDEQNGIYLVTSKQMHKLVWTGDRLSQDEADGAWTSAYSVRPEGEAKALGAASHGSGTTPSLMGFGKSDDKLVVIADGHPDGANLVAFWRDDIPENFMLKEGAASRRIAGQIKIRNSHLTAEPSPAVYGNGVVVLNSTYPEPTPIPGDLLTNAFTAGFTRPAPMGLLKFEWLSSENRFVERWSMDNIDNTDWMPPLVSSNGLVYIANRENGHHEYLAADWETGEIKAKWQFPDKSVLWNNWGGITVLMNDGDLLLGGFFAVKRYDIGHLR